MTNVDVDPGVPGFFTRDDYYDLLATLRRDAPLFEYEPGAWTVARYDDVRAISSDPARFCSGRGVLMRDPLRNGKEIHGSILHMDPPAHASWRRLGSRRFTPRAVTRIEPTVRAIAVSLLEDLTRGDHIDFVDSIAAPFPVLVIAELLGVPGADHEQFRRWSDAAISSTDEETPALGDLTALYQYLVELVRERRARPGNDVISAVTGAEVEGRLLTTAEAVGYCMALLVAGNETTRHLLSGAALTLSQHPEQRVKLCEEPALVPSAVEECLRWVTPIQAFGRTATCNTAIASARIRTGDWVVMLYASANRDERVFGPTAGAFDVSRPLDVPNVAFGFGEHLCLGAAVARLETRVMLEELLARFPGWIVTGEPHWVASTLVRGMEHLPVTL